MLEIIIRKVILDVLAGHGSLNPMVRQDILATMHDRGHPLTERIFRDIVSRMVIDEDAPIGSSTRGYFIITTQADLDEADNELKAKAESISVRRNCLLRAFRRLNQAKVQGTLFQLKDGPI